MHGGAFAAGSKDDMEQQSVTYCDSLAARGFVAIAVQYRLGITATLEEKVLTIDSLNFSRTVYRGIQDVRAAVRYVRSKASDLGIDKDRIYLLGNSAGAILALENIYMDKPSEVPAVAHDAPDLGELDIYGVQGENQQANAAVALWGGVHDPSIIGETASPVLLVHGTADSTVLFKTGRPLGNLANTLGVNMMMLKLAGINSISINTPTLYGSFVVDSVLKAKDVEHETYFVDDMPHEFYDEDGYGVKVREKVFSFLYGLTQKPASTKVLAVATARPSQVRMGEGNMNFTVASGSNLPYAVMDLRGRTVMSGRVSQGEVVGLEALERGVYVLRVKGERPLRFGLEK
jgi:poly(3-hydroxybutyrate) depolymerase